MTQEELKRAAKALRSVAFGDGMEIYGDEAAIDEKHFNDYMFVFVLAEMIDAGNCDIIIKGEKADYARLLLGLTEEHNED